MKRFRYIVYGVLASAFLLALAPVGYLASGWDAETPQTTDWVRWVERDGALEAAHVPPGSPAAEAGLEAGDVLYMFNYRPYREHEALQEAVVSAPPGEGRTYHVVRDDRFENFEVTLTAPPAFLYPLSRGLWNFSLWSFAFGAFFHLLGLIVVGPLVGRSRRARASLMLIGASSVWIISTLVRLIVVETAGWPDGGTSTRRVFDALALLGAVGWWAFPALLLHKVVCDTQEAAGQAPTPLRWLVWGPPLALAGVFLAALPAGSPVTGLLHVLTPPLLLYTCVFVTAAAALVLAYLRLAPASAPPGSWSDTGGASLLLCALLGGVLTLLAVPFFRPVADAGTGWLVVVVQLLPTVPVVLVMLATLRATTPSGVFTRALVYVAVLGAIFFAFVGGSAIIDAQFDRGGAAQNVAVGLFVVGLLLVFERLARRLRLYASHFFATGPQRARATLSRFQEQMRTILSHEALAQQTVAAVGEAFGARSVRLFLRTAAASEGDHAPEGDGASASASPPGWITGSYHPEPPYFTQRHFERVWPYLQREGLIWARNPELRDSTLPEQRAQMLEERGVALALPIMGEGAPIGLLAMSGKKKRGEMYNFGDLDLLRFLGGQLALATERLDLVARERALVRASAEAELAALRAQINPHFLFNALNTIASLIAVQPSEAEATVEHLAAIFRHILQTGSQPFVSLDEEFALVRHYLHIEQVRFGDALTVEVDLPPALAHHSVPAFAVQTLVENAVKHGIARQRGGGRVRVAVRRAHASEDSSITASSMAEVIVDDTGAGISALFDRDPSGDGAPSDFSGEHAADADPQAAPYPSFYGIGLRNVADRLERLYDRTDLLRLTSTPDEGSTARLRLPPAPEPDEDTSSSGAPPEALRRV